VDGLTILDIGKEAIWVYLKIALPILLVALIVGLMVALFQALTQIQEATLSFVPKMIAIFLCLIMLMSYISSNMQVFAQSLSDRIAQIE
jgi:flagellar biosynthesis protein FliQ